MWFIMTSIINKVQHFYASAKDVYSEIWMTVILCILFSPSLLPDKTFELVPEVFETVFA